jgi:hypothetical protein
LTTDIPILCVNVSYDATYYQPWGCGKIVTPERARRMLAEFLEQFGLAWDPSDYDPARDTVEGRYLSAGGPDDYDEYFGLAPVSTRPTLLCGHEPQPEVPHWIVSHNGEEVYTREGELLEDEGDEEEDSEYTDAG